MYIYSFINTIDEFKLGYLIAYLLAPISLIFLLAIKLND